MMPKPVHLMSVDDVEVTIGAPVEGQPFAVNITREALEGAADGWVDPAPLRVVVYGRPALVLRSNARCPNPTAHRRPRTSELVTALARRVFRR